MEAIVLNRHSTRSNTTLKLALRPSKTAFNVKFILQITLCKPCSVLYYIQGNSKEITIYLRENTFAPRPLFLIPREKCPYHKFEFLARGVYLVPLPSISAGTSSLWHLQGYKTISKRLRSFTCRQTGNPECPGLLFDQARSLRASQHRASMDFPLLS